MFFANYIILFIVLFIIKTISFMHIQKKCAYKKAAPDGFIILPVLP